VSGQQFPLFKDMIGGQQLAISNQQLAIAQGSAFDPTSGAQAPSSAYGGNDTMPPQGGLASDLANGQGLTAKGYPTIEDRGIYHASDAMKDLVDMGDAPSCHVCGAIMTRNGSCYRCMSCGSTSGCS
jgi:ribonucleoside-diphosphate reductase alpha chain